MIAKARLLGLAGFLLIPAGLSAQACLGAHQAAHGWIGAQVARTSLEHNSIGAELGVRASSWATVRLEADLVRLEEPTPARKRARAGVVLGSDGLPLPICLSASAMVTRMGELTILTVPIGIIAGLAIPIGSGGSSLTSYLEPQLSYRRASLAEFHTVSVPFSMTGGTGLVRGRVYGGAHVEWAPSESRGWAVGLRAVVGF